LPISKIRISDHFCHQSAAFFLKNSKMAMRNYRECEADVKVSKNCGFCPNSRSPLYFPISTPRRGASHHVHKYNDP
jgi:hypothetical protein